jgi:uncharacterized OB-fold protein
MKCLKCGIEIATENASLPCPKCGSGDRSVEVYDDAHVYDMVKVKQDVKSHHKCGDVIMAGTKVGGDGKPVRVFLHIDKKNGKKIHRVEIQNKNGEWVEDHNHIDDL